MLHPKESRLVGSTLHFHFSIADGVSNSHGMSYVISIHEPCVKKMYWVTNLSILPLWNKVNSEGGVE